MKGFLFFIKLQMLAFLNEEKYSSFRDLRKILNVINYLACWAESLQNKAQGQVESLRVGPMQVEGHL